MPDDSKSARPSLCYLLPSYDPDTEEHFFHIYRLLELLGRDLELAVVIERCRGVPSFPTAAEVVVQRWTRWFPLRVLEIVAIFLRLRWKGCRLFYVHYSFFGGIFWNLLGRLTGVRVFYWHCVSRTFKKPWGLSREILLHKLKAELPLALTMRLCDTLVTGTRAVARFYASEFELSEQRIVVLPNEVELARFEGCASSRPETRVRLGLPPEAPVVLFLHRLAERKGAHLLPEIAACVLQKVPHCRFLVAGAGPCEASLRRQIADAGLASAFTFLGWVPNRDVPPLYGASDVYLMPSLEEGFPRAMLEAMAAGVPCVASDVGGVREILPQSMQRFVVPPGDAGAAGRAVIEQLSDATLRGDLAVACREKAAEYDLPRVRDLFLARIVAGLGEVAGGNSP